MLYSGSLVLDEITVALKPEVTSNFLSFKTFQKSIRQIINDIPVSSLIKFPLLSHVIFISNFLQSTAGKTDTNLTLDHTEFFINAPE